MAKAGSSVLFWALDVSTQQSGALASWAICFHKVSCTVSDQDPEHLDSECWTSDHFFQDAEGAGPVYLVNMG